LGNLGDERIILKRILKQYMVVWTGLPVSGYVPVAGSCGQENEPSGYIKGGEFFDWLRKY
jgi:hypothetical protein